MKRYNARHFGQLEVYRWLNAHATFQYVSHTKRKYSIHIRNLIIF